jgi:hypothetical protein
MMMRRRGHHCLREERFSNDEEWQGEIQQSTVADGGRQKEGQGNRYDDHGM